MAAPVDTSKLSYEEARNELVNVVSELEQGSPTLEQTLALWERGEALAARCEEWLIGAKELAAMKPGAILVNAERGPLVDEEALVAALRSGALAGAGLDVFATEPLAAGSPLRGFDNVFLSPHSGAATEEAEAHVLEVVGDNLLRVLDGEAPVNVVNQVLAVQR